MHTAEHILNQTMVRMFGCMRSKNTHIERRKSKCDYILPNLPTENQISEIEREVNRIISLEMNVSEEFCLKSEAANFLDLSKLPDDAPETIRVVRVGDYDTCACIGPHVENTREIGTFRIISTDYNEGILRIRFKLV